jgi:hypothetical protein
MIEECDEAMLEAVRLAQTMVVCSIGARDAKKQKAAYQVVGSAGKSWLRNFIDVALLKDRASVRIWIRGLGRSSSYHYRGQCWFRRWRFPLGHRRDTHGMDHMRRGY